ncbi:MAG: hypothetical protein ACI9JN_002641 [Bacteroidia bacterium]|jgi:hypothetical protein
MKKDLNVDGTIHLKGDEFLASTFTKITICLQVMKDNRIETDLLSRTNLPSYVDIEHKLRFVSTCEIDLNSYHGVRSKKRFSRIPPSTKQKNNCMWLAISVLAE